MKVNELITRLNLEVICPGNTIEAEIDGCYATDLLSLAMANVEKGNIWVTVQTNMNILGIAALAESSCVIVAQGMNVPHSVTDKAKEEGICILRSDMDVYNLCIEIGKLI